MDFENYSVDPERATGIRGRLAKLRESESIAALGLLVDEFGQDLEENSGDGVLPGFGKVSDKSRVFESAREILGEARVLRIEKSGQELRLFVGGKKLLDISFLPKNSEFLVNTLAPESEDELLQTALNAVTEDARLAKSKKSERQAAFKARFNKDAT